MFVYERHYNTLIKKNNCQVTANFCATIYTHFNIRNIITENINYANAT